MQIEIKDLGGLKREASVTIPKDVIETKFNAKIKTVAAQMKVDGFRPGKVPVKMAEEQHGPKVFHDMENELVNETMQKVAEDNKFKIAGVHNVDHDHKHEVADFSFTATFDVMPEIKPTALEGIKLTKATAKPDAKMLDEAKEDLKARMQMFKEKDGKAQKGDRVVVTGQGYKVEGKTETPFDGGKLEDFPIVLGSNSLIPGFEEQLEGTKAGDKKDVKVPFPKDYHAADLAGKDSVFKLEVLKIEESDKPEWDDALATQLGQENVAKLNEVIETSIQRDLDSATEQRMKRELFDHLDKKHTFDVPESMLNREVGGLVQSQVQDAQRRGQPMPEDLEAMKKEMAPIATRRVKLGLLLAEIAREQKIDIKAEDLQHAVQQQIQQAGQQAQQAAEHFSKPENQQQLVGPLLEEKVVTWLFEKAKITEEETTATELVKEFSA